MLDPARLSALCRKLRQSAPKTESRRRLPESHVQAMSRLGLFRALVPGVYGGLEGSFSELSQDLLALAAACPSSAWVGSLFAVHSVIVAWFPAAAQEEVWADGPDARIGSSLAPMGRLEKGRLSGRWSFSSGLTHADWLLLGARQGERSLLALVPAREALAHDDWRVAGLSGSGSQSLSLEGVAVPAERQLSTADLEAGRSPGARLHPASVFHLPWRPLFSYAFVPPVLGAGLAALEECRTLFAERRSAFTGLAYKERTLAWTALAQSQGELDAARALMQTDWEELEAGPASRALTLRASYHPALIARLCRDAVNRLFHASGASALYLTHPLQRHFRDVHAIGQHPALNSELAAETYGRALLDPQEPPPAR